MRPANEVLLDGAVVIITKDSEQVGFESVESFQSYCSVSAPILTQHSYICYVPEQYLITETYRFTPERSDWSEVTGPLDAILLDFDNIKTKKDNRFFGLTLKQAQDLRINDLLLRVDVEDAKPFEFPDESGVFYKVTSAIANTLLRFQLENLSDSTAIPVNNGRWDNVDGTVSTPFTVGDLKALYLKGYSIPEANYQNFKAHAYAIMSCLTVEEVGEYSIESGWQ